MYSIDQLLARTDDGLGLDVGRTEGAEEDEGIIVEYDDTE